MKTTLKKLPTHVGFIMDGNGRWAKNKGLARSFGHKAGESSMNTIIKECFYKYHIPNVSIYAFSTENWNRPQQEIDFLFKLMRKYFSKNLQKMYPEVRLNIMGDLSKFPKDIIENTRALTEKTKDNTKYTLNLCINYSGRQELVRAFNNALSAKLKQVDENGVNTLLYSCGQPDLDLVVRTGGEQRLSNFMLWQASYAELYFTKTLWPDFKKDELLLALQEYQRRDRRFGAIEEE